MFESQTIPPIPKQEAGSKLVALATHLQGMMPGVATMSSKAFCHLLHFRRLAIPETSRLNLDQRAGEKVLVFCQWEDLKKHIAETLQTMGVPHLQLTGNIYQRSEILRRFQELL